MNSPDFLPFACGLARDGGSLARRLRRDLRLDADQVEWKANPKDVVTEADRQTEAMITAAIRSAYPEHGILGEESGRSQSDSPYCWVIDPIDGTASYIHNQTFYSTSVGLLRDGKPVAGAVYLPELDELYYAAVCCGAFCNGRPIHVLDHGPLMQSQVATGFSCVRAGWTRNNLPYFCAVTLEAREVRRFGSAAADLCLVACGKLDAYWELNLQLYDYAAGWLIATEAGGRVTDLQGGDDLQHQGLMASNGALHDKMLSFFR